MYDISLTVTGLTSGTLIVLNSSPTTDELDFTTDGVQKFRLSLVSGQNYDINVDSISGADGLTCVFTDSGAGSGTMLTENIFLTLECFDGNLSSRRFHKIFGSTSKLKISP